MIAFGEAVTTGGLTVVGVGALVDFDPIRVLRRGPERFSSGWLPGVTFEGVGKVLPCGELIRCGSPGDDFPALNAAS